ncbi:MAG: DUF4167 domain-containing protein [Pseudomonadota bacterium]
MKRGRNQRRRQGVNPNRAYDSNGPEVRIRGTANQIFDKYQALARDAASAGDRVKAENYLQHAEHYFRLIRSMQPNAPSAQEQADPADAEQPSVGGAQRSERVNGRGRPSRKGENEEPAGASETPGEASEDVEAAASGADEEDAEQAAESAERTPRKRRARRPRAAKAEKPAENEETAVEEASVS